MKILRFIFFLLITIVIIHSFEVAAPKEDLLSINISPDTLIALDSIKSMKQKYFSLLSEESFWKNRIAAAKDPLFILTADLQDSLITLDHQGVAIHQTKVSEIQLSRGLRDNYYQIPLLKWIGSPFKLKSQNATVSKEPVQERFISSRREAESKLIHLRDPEDSNYVSIVLEFSRDLTLILNEAESDSINLPIHPEVIPGNNKKIILFLPRIDAMAIYRALPESTYLVLKL